ncbi:MAG: hypothetical protein AB9882_14190 [Ignavibacteriaceae bacterium]
MKKSLMLSVIILILINSISHSQNIEENSSTNKNMNLNGSHSICMSFGFKMNSGTSVNTSLTEVKTETNFISTIGYKYWFDNQWSVNISAGLFNVETNSNYTKLSSISVVPVLFGFSFYPEFLTLGKVGRVHFGVNSGIYFGSAVKTSTGDLINSETTVVNETVFGAEPNAGIDFFVSKWILLGPAISYHFVSEFKEVIGNRKNYSGVVFSVKIGVLL